jgi:hypothetical protein
MAECSMNVLEKVSIIKAVGCGGIDFDKLTAKGERGELPL